MTARPPLGAAADDLAEVERIVRAAGTSFHRGMRILPPDRRAAIYAIYAFCRIVDDIADDPDANQASRATALNAWRSRVTALYAGAPIDPVTRVLNRAIAAYHLPEAEFQAIIDGMQMDADHTILAPSLAELDLYCDRVAAAVGRLSVRAFGDASPAANQVAHHLGRALQYTNILRDLEEDAARARLYLPREWLAEAGLPLSLAALSHPALPLVCARVSMAAHAQFAAAAAAMAHCRPQAMRPARVMAAGYHAVLDALDRRGWHDLATRPQVGTWRKLRILAGALLPARALTSIQG